MSEDASTASLVVGLRLQALDEGNEPLSNEMWDITWGITPTDVFAIDAAQGIVRLAQATLDYATTPSYTVTVSVVASKAGDVTLTNSLEVTIGVLETITSWNIVDTEAAANTLFENAALDEAVAGMALVVRDADSNDIAVNWGLLNDAAGVFAISAASGVVRLAQVPLDYEMTSSYTIVLQAYSGTQAARALTTTIEILNVLERVFLPDSDQRLESISEDAVTGTTVSGLSLYAIDERGERLSDVVWTITASDGPFAIDTTSGVVRLSTATLDYEIATSHTITVSALASLEGISVVGSSVVMVLVVNVLESVRVEDSNAAANTLAENATAGTLVGGLGLELRDEGNRLQAAHWSLEDDAGELFAISSTNGTLSLTSAALDYESTPSYSVVVKAAAVADPSIATAVTITVTVTNIIESYTLQVMVAQNGMVRSSPAGILCGTDCSEVYNETQTITLSATAPQGYTHVGWAGDCSGSGLQVQIKSSVDVLCHAVFTVNLPTGVPAITQVGSGGTHSCAVRRDGIVYCWGAGAGGVLGNGSNTDSLQPVTVSGLSTASIYQ